MTEISCPECGAQNPLQSKYCNRCGASFANSTTHICAACNTPNPVNLVYCDNCGTRLVDDESSGRGQQHEDEEESKRGGRSQPFSLPARPPGQTGDLDVSAELPDWLKTGDFSGDFAHGALEDDDLEWIRSAREDDTWEDEDAPTLEELSSDHAPRDDLPTWLLDEDTDGTIFSGEKSTDELFMASMAADDDEAQGTPAQPEHGESQPERSESVAPGDATSELHSWLSDMEAEDPEPADAAAEEPAGSDEEPDEPETPPSTGLQTLEEDDFLKWLSEIQQESASEEREPDPLAGEATDVPDWLGAGDEDAPARSSSEAEAEAADLETPDWLIDLGEESAGQVGRDAFTGSEMEAPDRLDEPSLERREGDSGGDTTSERDLDTTDEPVSDAAGHESSAQGTGSPEGAQEDEFLQWLNSLGSDDEAAPDTSGTDWISETETESEAPADDFAVTPPYVSGSEVETEGDAFAQGDASGRTSKGGAKEDALGALPLDADEVELPEWIAGVTAELELEDPSGEGPEVEQGDEAGDEWLQAPPDDLSVEGDEGFYDSVAFDLDDQQVTSEDLPDWFSDVLKDIEIREERQASQAPSPELENVPQQLAGSELPDWLDSPFVDEPAAEPTPLEEIPEWLRAPLKERLARAAEERGLDESALDSGDEWRELLEAPLRAEEVSEHRDKDAVPAWLESIRSAAQARSEGAETDNKADEPRGPMRGIAGAIEIAPVVAQATHRERPATSVASTEQDNQALLLRQLARLQEDGRRTAVPSPSGASALSPLTRLLLATLLLVATVAGLTAGRLWPDIAAVTAGSSTEPFLPATLSASSGEPILLVFDYTPAMSGVLDPLAQELLQGLVDQGSVALVASQSASGLALARSAVESSSLTQVTDLGLIPGGALGVRRLGRCLQGGASCESLFGQSVDEEAARLLLGTSEVIVITGDRDHLLAWLEQLDTPGTVSLSALVTPALEPAASPYFASGQLVEMAVADGRVGAASATDVTSSSTALLLSRLLIAAAMVVGAIFYLFTGFVRSRRA